MWRQTDSWMTASVFWKLFCRCFLFDVDVNLVRFSSNFLKRDFDTRDIRFRLRKTADRTGPEMSQSGSACWVDFPRATYFVEMGKARFVQARDLKQAQACGRVSSRRRLGTGRIRFEVPVCVECCGRFCGARFSGSNKGQTFETVQPIFPKPG